MANTESDPSKLEALEERLDQIQDENRRLTQIVGKLSSVLDSARSTRKGLLLPNGKEIVGTNGNGLAALNGQAVVDRRTALRNLGKAAAAGVGLAAASSMLRPGVAEGAHGASNETSADAEATRHTTNTGGGAAIVGTNSGTEPTLILDNNRSSSGEGGPALRLEESVGLTGTVGIGGDMMSIDDTGLNVKNLFFAHFGNEKSGSNPSWGKVLTDANFSSNELLILSAPSRVVDTRDAAKRPGLGAGTDPLADDDYTIDLTAFLSSTDIGIVATLTAVHASGAGLAGFLALWPSGAWPGTSNINFPPGNTSGIATLAMTGVSAETCKLRVAGGGAGVHVILDLIARVQPS